jgi:hypothetical protein
MYKPNVAPVYTTKWGALLQLAETPTTPKTRNKM